ncbi:hypothetical protein DdX_11127 [Ditylenchus destructor]|uniref:Uncharacterized protein n=1 Tax=Ditylenchus destructor TaxID=166010 RepID=A0AAD4N2W0_9BILA|nr:hypothetical protein DdX_11127 [Ditylenchus destructor]
MMFFTKYFLLSILHAFLEQCYCMSFITPPEKYSVPVSRKELINELQGLNSKVHRMRSKWESLVPLPPRSELSLKDLLSRKEELSPSEDSRPLPEEPNQEFRPKLAEDSDEPVIIHHRLSPSDVPLGILRKNFNQFQNAQRLLEALNIRRLQQKDARSVEPALSSLEQVNAMEKEKDIYSQPSITMPSNQIDTETDSQPPEDVMADSEPKTSPDSVQADNGWAEALAENVHPLKVAAAQPSIRDCLFLRSGCGPSREFDPRRTSAYLDKVQALFNAMP